MNRSTATLTLLSAALAAGCASVPSATADLPADRFVTLNCADGKSFQVRRAQNGQTVRVRSHQGSAELERQADGRFAGESFVLDFKAEGGISLEHASKSQGKACKRAV
jgi:hypothetical protein